MLNFSKKHVHYHHEGKQRPVSMRERVIVGLCYLVAGFVAYYSIDWVVAQLISTFYGAIIGKY